MSTKATTHTPPNSHGDSLTGKIIQGNYHILEKVAKGGMAWIYRAEHVQLRNYMAIKILFPQLLEEPDLCERFLEEARIQFNLRHPNIIQVTDVISENGLVGIVLEWINGRDLRYWLKEHKQPFSTAQVREIMIPVVEAIGYAHEKGVIHRDLKPGNILFHHEGKRVIPKVADFGIAKMLNEVDSQTKTGTMMGTLQYMSPEQIRDSKYVDQRSDIYSLGVILYRICAGHLPFREKNALALMRQHEHADPPLPQESNPNISDELSDIILRCLEKEPSQRFQTCGELLDALGELPEASIQSKSGLFPAYLIGQPTKDDFGDPHQSTPHGVKRVSFDGEDLPTGSIAGGDYASSLGIPRHSTNPPISSSTSPPTRNVRPTPVPPTRSATSPPVSRTRPPSRPVPHHPRHPLAPTTPAPLSQERSFPPRTSPPRPAPQRAASNMLERPIARTETHPTRPPSAKPISSAQMEKMLQGPPPNELELDLEEPMPQELVLPSTSPSSPLIPEVAQAPTSTPAAPPISPATPPPSPSPSRLWLSMFALLFLMVGGGAGTYYAFFFAPQQPIGVVDAGPTLPPPLPRENSRDQLMAQLDKAIKEAVRAATMQDLALASNKLKFAMSLKAKGSKKPIWEDSSYYPQLYDDRGRIALARKRFHEANVLLNKYVNADVKNKTPLEIAKHRAKSQRIKRELLPQLRVELKTRVSQAEELLGNIDKDLKRNKPERALSFFQKLQQTVTSVPSVYQKLARTVQNFFPALAASIYKNILDDMLPSPKLTNELLKEQSDLQKRIDSQREAIRDAFKTLREHVQNKRLKPILQWLAKNYRAYQSYKLLHDEMAGLLVQAVSQDLKYAQRILSAYIRLFKQNTERGLVPWAASSSTPIDLPTLKKLQEMRDALKRWGRFVKVMSSVRQALLRKNILAAKQRLRQLPKGWQEWIKDDHQGLHKRIAPGVDLVESYRSLKGALQNYQSAHKQFLRAELSKAIFGFAKLKQRLAASRLLPPLVSAKAVQSWKKHVTSMLKQSNRGLSNFERSKSLYRRKKWKNAEDGFRAYLKQFPQCYNASWVKKKIHQCQCNRNVPWVWCGKKKNK